MHDKTRVFVLSQSLMITLLVICPGDVTGQFTAAPLTCQSSKFIFTCIVNGDMSGYTIWRVNGSSECALPHRSTSSPICGPGNAFTARHGSGLQAGADFYSSTLSGTATSALNGLLVECFGPANSVDPGNRVDGSTLRILGPPSVPSLSCLGLSQDVSGAVNVNVSWTLSSGDSADFYLITITTNAPQTPYGGLLNITSASVTQQQLTGFMADYEYNITVHGVNCGTQEGGESEPLTITPQIPAAPGSCNVTLLYDHSSRRLQFIDTTWDLMPEPNNQHGDCQGPTGRITQHQIRFKVGSTVFTTMSVNISACTTERCSYTFYLSNVPSGTIPSSYDRVSVAAINAVGVGAERTCTAQTISTTNNLLSGGMVDVNSPDDAMVICTFLCEFNFSAHCTVQYGTDPTYMNLQYSAESTETGTAGDSVSVVLREQLNSSTVYYYIVSAVRENVMVTVQRNFTTPHSFNCSTMELWNFTTTTSFLSDITLLNDAAAHYPSCDAESVGSAVLKDTTLNTATVAYYSGTTPGSTVCFVCDERNGYEPNAPINMRVCQSNATWSKSPIVCICTQSRLQEWHMALIVLWAFFLVISIVLTIILFVIAKTKDTMTRVNCYVTYGHLLFAAILCMLGMLLWIPVGLVVSNPPSGNVCDQGWSQSRDTLIILGFVFPILSYILLFTSLFIHTILLKYCEKRWKKRP